MKTLEGRGLVKNVKSVQHANRKVYMLAELEPAREITGGAWQAPCTLSLLKKQDKLNTGLAWRMVLLHLAY